MRRTSIVLVILAAVIGVVIYLMRDGNRTEVDVEALVREQARREAERLAKSQDEQTDLGLLAEKGIGQALPEYLASEIGVTGKFWFVGKPGNEVGVEIPFEPGKIALPPSEVKPLRENPGFLGAEACRSCHQDKYDTFVHTAHYRTSRIAKPENISGSFEEGRNQMRTSEPNVFFDMIQRDGTAYQRVSFFDWQFEVPFHLIIGSSKMAETYLYWHDDKLFEMNCTYLSGPDTWINSPGFIDGDAAYARPIVVGCLECHTTYAELRKPPNHFTPSSLILGVTCERCHGPGKEHVEYHSANPMEKKAKLIAVPSSLSRQQQMDVCGQCHSTETIPKVEIAFQFRPGDSLDDHYERLEGHEASAGSVHTSNQVARVSLSECFKQSEMGCVECHNPHRNERGQTGVFSQRCMNCHASDQCGESDRLGLQITENCIDCHMPVRATDNLRFETDKGNVFPPLRDHYIRVDAQATEEFYRSKK